MGCTSSGCAAKSIFLPARSKATSATLDQIRQLLDAIAEEDIHIVTVVVDKRDVHRDRST